jgi:hypothetical protein
MLAAQPLAVRLRHLHCKPAAALDGILLPDGTLAPPCHQHADAARVETFFGV